MFSLRFFCFVIDGVNNPCVLSAVRIGPLQYLLLVPVLIWGQAKSNLWNQQVIFIPTHQQFTFTFIPFVYTFSMYLWCYMSCGVFVYIKMYKNKQPLKTRQKKPTFFLQGNFPWLLHQYITIYLLLYYRGILYWYHMLK